MTAELVLLLAFYAMFILGIFMHPEWGLTKTFHSSLPTLSARIEKHVACGQGFWGLAGADWEKPPKDQYSSNFWGL